MIFLIFVTLLSSGTYAEQRASSPSLWGKVADFSFRCSHWRLKPRVSIPALREFTVCLSVQIEALKGLPWTAFMYRHPAERCAELGLGGKRGRLAVWWFGAEWMTPPVSLWPARWHSLCLTGSRTRDGPALYVNGTLMEMTAHFNTCIPVSTSCCKLSPNGTLTLGAAHVLVNGNIQVNPLMRLPGKLSLFRLWGREYGPRELTSLKCTEGQLVKWERDDWDMQFCVAVPDPGLQCEWSLYEVQLMFTILRWDGKNTELYMARDIAHMWLRKVLLTDIYLHRVSVFHTYRSDTEATFLKAYKDMPERWVPLNADRFNCLVYMSVIPGLDVALVQSRVHTALRHYYRNPNGPLLLRADPDNIRTTPIERFSAVTLAPPDVITAPTSVKSTVFTTTFPAADTSQTTTVEFSTTAAATLQPFTHDSLNVSVLYFEVQVNVSITGDYEALHVLSTWLNTSLPDDMMLVLDLQLLPKARRSDSTLQTQLSSSEEYVHKVTRESCIFQVQVMMIPTDTQEMEERIRTLLLMPYNDGSISIATEGVQISRIMIFRCTAETHHTQRGLFQWPVTSGGKNATLPCPKNAQRYATRHCKLCLSTKWMAPDLQDCPLLVETIPDLDHIEVISENAQEVVEMIEDLVSKQSKLSSQELVTVLDKLLDIVTHCEVTPALGQALINVISSILGSDSDLLPFTNTILNITEAVGDRMVGFQGSSTLVAPDIAVSVVDVVPEHFATLTFGVSSDRTGSKPEIFINKSPVNGTVAFISLPPVLQHSFPQNSSSRIQFQFYGIPQLFKSSQKGQILYSFVVSASVTNASSPVQDLEEDVQPYMDIRCVYWNFNKNNGLGGWDDHGCRKDSSSANYTTCLCDHLTHFGVLLEVSRTRVDLANEEILTIITYVGCGVSSLFLGVTVLTYTVFEKLRRDYPSQILINLSLALLGLNLVFLVNSWLSSWGLYGLCIAAASTLHYFLLASFTWMGLEAVNMYFALIKVFNVYVPSYILKFCALGWGIPLVICVLVLIVDRDAYGARIYTNASPEPLDDFCWLQDDITFYVSVVAYALLVLLFNISVFVVVLIQIRRMRINSPAGSRRGLTQDLKGVASLTLLLGLTWTVGFFTWGPGRVVLLYLFSGLNTLQGIFIFLFHCLMKENVRKEWRINLCFGRFRLEDHSEWSNSGSVGAVPKPRAKAPRASVPSVHSVKSSSTDSTSASSDSSQRNSSCKRPNLGLFVNYLSLPRAQRSPSVAGHPLQKGMN